MGSSTENFEVIESAATEEDQLTIDAKEIVDTIIAQIKIKNANIKGYYKETKVFGSFFDTRKNGTNVFDAYIVFQYTGSFYISKMPCGHIRLQLDFLGIYHHHHPWNSDKWISGTLIHSDMKEALKSIFIADYLVVRLASGNRYRVQPLLKDFDHVHSFVAQNIDDKNCEISINVMPAFEFGKNQWPSNREFTSDSSLPWYAVPLNDIEHKFIVSAPYLEKQWMHDNEKLLKALKLIVAVRDENGMFEIRNCALKTMFLIENDIGDATYWERDLSAIFLEMLRRLHLYLENGLLPYYWNRKLNLLEGIDALRIDSFKKKLKELLQEYKNQPDKSELAKVLFINKENVNDG